MLSKFKKGQKRKHFLITEREWTRKVEKLSRLK